MSMAQEQATVDEAEYSHLVRLLSQLFPRKAFRRQEILKAKVDRASYEVTLSSLAASRTNRAHQLLKEASTILAGESVPTVDATPCPKESSSSHHDRRHHKSHRGRKEHSMDSKETMSPLSSPIQSAHSLLISDAVLKYKLAHFILPSLPHVPKDTWHHIPIPMDEEEEEEEEEERKLVTLPSSPTPNHHPQHSKTISSVGQGQKKKGIRGILAPIFDHRHKHSLVKEEERAISDLIDKGLAQAQSESRTSKKETEEWTQVLDDRRGDLAHFWAEMVESI
ncbi:hypothetical protein BJ684DRAFT_22133 [Piptocephalis cylindrospora]|uniref:Uncharacterized protein n=1 Tax=Piptocephalis cylindrospora TaxID=1907219 RepID=A0A4P9XXX9_9FUNG|nr:hypothetical protein BJ684DRAFT_22133 [Piptocephalis cylindrospora]|eukprot:RKP11313.1 hypothetical protein BJ684DRAFT_22133 [Piptocephalis cylindrospora]